MDPNAALARIRAFIESYRSDDSSESVDWEDIDDAVEAFEGLDDWLSKGGFKPDDWKDKP